MRLTKRQDEWSGALSRLLTLFENMEQSINRKFAFTIDLLFPCFLAGFYCFPSRSLYFWQDSSQLENESQKLRAFDYDQIAELYLENTEMIIESLENLKGAYSPLISFMVILASRETAITQWQFFVQNGLFHRVKTQQYYEC